MERLIDEKTVIPFGKHKGEKLCNVPAQYLLFMFSEGKLYGDIKQYVIQNKDILEKEVKSDNQWKRTHTKK